PLEGGGRAGGAEPQPDARPRRGGRIAVTVSGSETGKAGKAGKAGKTGEAGGATFFRSRWVDPPEAVTELGRDELPDGFRAAGVAEARAAAGAGAAGVSPQRVGVASTGVIGLGLERSRVVAGIELAVAALSPSAREFAHSLLTTDRWPKHASLEVALARGPVKL